jgi:hypothetical protein
MNLPLFHDPLQGTVTVDAPVRDPRGDVAFGTETEARPNRTRSQATKPRRVDHRPAPTRSARQLKVAEDLQALMARTATRH